MYSKKERADYNRDRAIKCKELNITENQYNWLRRKGEELRRIYTAACNGEIDYGQEYERAVNPLEKSVIKYAGKLGLFVYFQTDPRGATIYADIKPIPEANYNRAHCIY
jgi:hypothetical protein